MYYKISLLMCMSRVHNVHSELFRDSIRNSTNNIRHWTKQMRLNVTYYGAIQLSICLVPKISDLMRVRQVVKLPVVSTIGSANNE